MEPDMMAMIQRLQDVSDDTRLDTLASTVYVNLVQPDQSYEALVDNATFAYKAAVVFNEVRKHMLSLEQLDTPVVTAVQ